MTTFCHYLFLIEIVHHADEQVLLEARVRRFIQLMRADAELLHPRQKRLSGFRNTYPANLLWQLAGL
jgi:hypothetical protein